MTMFHSGNAVSNIVRLEIRDLFLDVAAKLEAHGGQEPIGKAILTARCETLKQSGTEDGNGTTLIIRRGERPSAFAGIGDMPGEVLGGRLIEEGSGGQVRFLVKP